MLKHLVQFMTPAEGEEGEEEDELLEDMRGEGEPPAEHAWGLKVESVRCHVSWRASE